MSQISSVLNAWRQADVCSRNCVAWYLRKSSWQCGISVYNTVLSLRIYSLLFGWSRGWSEKTYAVWALWTKRTLSPVCSCNWSGNLNCARDDGKCDVTVGKLHKPLLLQLLWRSGDFSVEALWHLREYGESAPAVSVGLVFRSRKVATYTKTKSCLNFLPVMRFVSRLLIIMKYP